MPCSKKMVKSEKHCISLGWIYQPTLPGLYIPKHGFLTQHRGILQNRTLIGQFKKSPLTDMSAKNVSFFLTASLTSYIHYILTKVVDAKRLKTTILSQLELIHSFEYIIVINITKQLFPKVQNVAPRQ